MEANKKQCPEFPYFGARYPDACCVDGQLYDMDDCDTDGNLYVPIEYHPCPFCNTDLYVEHLIDEEEGITKEMVVEYVEKLRAKYS